MQPGEIQQLVLMVGVVLAIGGLLCGGLLLMTNRLAQAAEAQQQEFLANWQTLAQSLGPTVTGPYRNSDHEWEIKGSYRGYPLTIQSNPGRKDNPSYTTVIVKVAHQADFHFKASSDTNVGQQYLSSGDIALDEKYNFLSNPPGLLRQVAANPATRSALLQSNCRWMLASPYDMMCGVRGMEKNLQRLHTMIDLTIAMADLVQAEVGRSIPQQPPRPPLDYLLVESVVIRLPRRLVGVGLVVGLALVVGACTVGMSLWMRTL